ncbi:LD-carboxypeptidase [Miniimonas sp. S16]|uniref:LD-carboxypeptidase n=1 Tax=Miniimonas sp. S16 TaxID=2171623 RepID=UPI001901692F|nr:LD-carboxypeptidase [Miniimonas sp. S16]
MIASLSGPLPAMYEPNVTRTERVLEGMGFRVRRAPLLEVGRQRWWSSASPAQIAAELNGLLRDPEVRAIVASDGGQTVFGYLDLVDLDAIRADPKPVLGYSDLSLLHLALVQATRFAVPPEWFDGAVLFWEEIGGIAAHVWSYLQVMRHAGILDRISGMVVGVPRDIAGLDGPGEPSLREIVDDVLGDRDIPVLAGVDVGHAGANLPMPVGIRVGLDAGERTLALLEPAVR